MSSQVNLQLNKIQHLTFISLPQPDLLHILIRDLKYHWMCSVQCGVFRVFFFFFLVT